MHSYLDNFDSRHNSYCCVLIVVVPLDFDAAKKYYKVITKKFVRSFMCVTIELKSTV